MVGGSGGLSEYLVQQSHEFHRRVDNIEERVQKIEDKLGVLEYNILRLIDKIDESLARPLDNMGGKYEKYVKAKDST
tara:strand:+ start:198 stop:428 length:231 start_codon:yes stop_codon:yes gene_type:complete